VSDAIVMIITDILVSFWTNTTRGQLNQATSQWSMLLPSANFN